MFLLMQVSTANSQYTTEIDDEVFRAALSVFPEERLLERPLLAAALEAGRIEFATLQRECAIVLLPWQMFFLTKSNLEKELARIAEKRSIHLVSKLAGKREGRGGPTSRRILDRLIRLQHYTSANAVGPKNSFCGTLKGLSAVAAARKIREHFGIDLANLRRRNKASALTYLVNRVESKHVNVCQGVLANKILPMFSGVRSVYKNTSGFALHDDRIPYIFLPSEVNRDERDGRQIYTLAFLVAVIGLDAYSHVIAKDFTTRALKSSGREKKAYDIASELLVPDVETDALRGGSITAEIRDHLASDFKITPTALTVILRRRQVITEQEYVSLLPTEKVPPRPKTRTVSTPKAITSVKKFVGRHGFEAIRNGWKSKLLTSVQAQYLIFGATNKKTFRELRSQI